MLHNGSTPNAITEALDARKEALRFDHYVALWHTSVEHGIAPDDTVLLLHRANFELWHLEDAARDPNAQDSLIADRKRDIDRVNQQRNNLAERADEELLAALSARALPVASSPLHSETPGMMLDRLSILSLKIFHTAEEIVRPGASPAHIARNRERHSILQQQRDDLVACLANLWDEVCRGKRRFVFYRQMKMYNDPELNPVLYTAVTGGPQRSA